MANSIGIATPANQPLTLVDSLSTPYGLKELPPSLALKQQNINRRQHLANILLQRGIQPLQGQQAGRFYVPPHWSQGVSQLAQAGLGAYMTYQGSKDTEALGQENKDILEQGKDKVAQALANVQAVPPSQLTPTPTDPQVQAPQQGPPQQDPRAAVMEAMAGQPGQAPQESATDTLQRLLSEGGGPDNSFLNGQEKWQGPIPHYDPSPSPSGMQQNFNPNAFGGRLQPPETPPIPSYANMSEMSGQAMAPPQTDPRAQVAQAMMPPQAPMPGAMPSPASAPMQGPMSPGTPGRARTPEEQRQAAMDLMANEHPQLQEMGKMLLNQMQHTENMGALRDERVENRKTLHEEKQDALRARTEEKKQLTDIQQKQFEMTYDNSVRKLDQDYQANMDRLRDSRTTHEEQNRLTDDQRRIEREKIAWDKVKTDKELESRKEIAGMKGGAGGKALPGSIGGKFMENSQNLRMAERAKALIEGQTVEGVKGDQNATGMKGYLPDAITQRMDPGGVETRAAVANLGSMIIHDRSGAAVTASEYPRLRPFIPTATDDPKTVKKKLGQFVTEYQKINEEMTQFYTESGYHVPSSDWHQSPEVAPPATGMTPTVPAFHDPAKQKRYEEFKKSHTP